MSTTTIEHSAPTASVANLSPRDALVAVRDQAGVEFATAMRYDTAIIAMVESNNASGASAAEVEALHEARNMWAARAAAKGHMEATCMMFRIAVHRRDNVQIVRWAKKVIEIRSTPPATKNQAYFLLARCYPFDG